MKIGITKEDDFWVLKIYTKRATLQEQKALIKKIPELFNELKESIKMQKYVNNFMKKNSLKL